MADPAVRTVPIHSVIADRIVAMEGNGPLNGTPRALGTIVLADDPVAADATCACLMGFDPGRVVHIRQGSRFLGNASPWLVDQAGEIPTAPTSPFQVVPEFQYLHAFRSAQRLTGAEPRLKQETNGEFNT